MGNSTHIRILGNFFFNDIFVNIDKIYMLNSIDKKNSGLKLLFLALGLFILLLGITSAKTMLIASGVSSPNLESLLDIGYFALMWTVIFTVVYVVIYFLYQLMKGVHYKKSVKREGHHES